MVGHLELSFRFSLPYYLYQVVVSAKRIEQLQTWVSFHRKHESLDVPLQLSTSLPPDFTTIEQVCVVDVVAVAGFWFLVDVHIYFSGNALCAVVLSVFLFRGLWHAAVVGSSSCNYARVPLSAAFSKPSGNSNGIQRSTLKVVDDENVTPVHACLLKQTYFRFRLTRSHVSPHSFRCRGSRHPSRPRSRRPHWKFSETSLRV